MKIETKYQGRVEVKEEEIWTFEKGIPGFLNEKQFVILPLIEDNDIYTLLQSVQTPELGFVIINPFLFFKDYSCEIDDSTLEQLEIEKEKDVLIYSILTIQDKFENTTANLQAPLVFNIKNKKAKQIILSEGDHKVKHFILPEKVKKG